MNKYKNYINNISITYKISAISLIAVVCFLFFIFFQYQATARINKLLLEIETVDKPIIKLLDDNFLAFMAARSGITAANTEHDMEGVDSATTNIEKIIESLNQVKQINTSVTGRADELSMGAQRYLNLGVELAMGQITQSIDPIDANLLGTQLKVTEEDFLTQHNQFREQRDIELNNKLVESRKLGTQATRGGVLLAIFISGLLILITFFIVRLITSALQNAISIAEKIAEGDRESDVKITSNDETGQLLKAIDKMRNALKIKEQSEATQKQEQDYIAGLNDTLRGEHNIKDLTQRILNYLAPVLNAQIAALYLLEGEQLKLTSTYAFTRRKSISSTFALGENLIGQAALEKKQFVIENIPQDYIAISSGLGSTNPKNIIVTPIINDDQLEGILELGTVHRFNSQQLDFLEKISASIAIAINSTRSQNKLQEILEVTQEQATALKKSETELQQQQESLRVSNEELEAQANRLRASEEHLQTQQEELRVINEELEAQTKALEAQKENLEQKNIALANSKKEIEEKSAALQKSSQYKSEFLSTMSHELRTPLNSILILSKILADNKTNNLTGKQIEHVEVIHSAGTDLLELINDILDLSKIEEGKLDFVVDLINIRDWADNVKKSFSPVVENKGLKFEVRLSEKLPEIMLSDRHRIDQIVKNMVSNAMKFTEHGSITIDIDYPKPSSQFQKLNLKKEDCICFSVIDTGIGIAKDKQELIFEAFQQADGTTSRKYGGTGLGLTISRQLSAFLGGDLTVYSDGEGLGSTFSLIIPLKAKQALALPPAVLADMESHAAPYTEASASLKPKPLKIKKSLDEKLIILLNTLLIIEDDTNFSSTLSELAHEHGFETLHARDGESALALLNEKIPSAIILDVGLPGISGWEVMDKLKENPYTQNIPVHFISGHDSKDKAMQMGAMGFLMKPVDITQLSETFSRIESETLSGVKRLLVIEDNSVERLAIEKMFIHKDTKVTMVATGQDAINELSHNSFDCIIMDLDLPDINGLALLEALSESEKFEPVPVIVYTAKDLQREEEALLRRYASRIILKTGESAERLLNEVSLFLHWLENKNDTSPKSIAPTEGRNDLFQNKRILVVDDDMRNIYSLSAVLEGMGFDCVLASNGIECLELLRQEANIDCILMDIMMPEMDGYETMQKIRAQKQFKDVPIIALTAKAMKDDKQKCIEAGANDYITKPLDTDKLLALLRVWLSQK